MFQRRNHNFIAILCIAGANLRPRDDVGIFYRWISKISMHFRCVPCSAAKLHSPRTLKHIKVRSAQTCKWAFVCIAIGFVESKIIIIVFSPALCIRKFEREIVRGWCMCVTCVFVCAYLCAVWYRWSQCGLMHVVEYAAACGLSECSQHFVETNQNEMKPFCVRRQSSEEKCE